MFLRELMEMRRPSIEELLDDDGFYDYLTHRLGLTGRTDRFTEMDSYSDDDIYNMWLDYMDQRNERI